MKEKLLWIIACELADHTLTGPAPAMIEYYFARLWEKPTWLLARYWKRFVVCD